MITVKLMGGLGNQMFQYSLGRSLALKNNTDLTLDVTHYDEYSDRKFELGCFNLPDNIIFNGRPKKYFDVDINAPPGRKIKTALNSMSGSTRRITEYGFSYDLYGLIGDSSGKVARFDKDVLKVKNNTYLVGFWQSEDYFKANAATIREDFTLKNRLSKGKQLVNDKIAKSSNPVSLQVRRGDYVTNAVTKDIMGLMSISYYKKAVKLLSDRLKDIELFVISDDFDWCKDNLKFNCPTTFVEHVPGTGHEDMYLMSKCDHHIIANSTFSWWGAWLNPNPDKVVVAPKIWYKDKKFNSSDIVPSEWLKI